MLGLSSEAQELADATLNVEGEQLPVHMYILAANSPVFAEIFKTALSSLASQPQGQRSEHTRFGASRFSVTLADRLATVNTVLRYSYAARYITWLSPNKPAVQNHEDAVHLVRFAHKYAMKALLFEAESYLVEHAKESEGKMLFETPQKLVSLVELAEAYSLDNDKISHQCLLRMLRGSALFRQRSTILHDELRHDCEQRWCTCGRMSCTCVQSMAMFALDLKQQDVNAEMLLQWHKDM